MLAREDEQHWTAKVEATAAVVISCWDALVWMIEASTI